MAHILERLLGSTDPLFATALVKLEQSARSEGVDVRLIADITHTAHQIMRTLQLDPANSTALEVYSALRAHVAKTEREELLTTDYIIFIVGRELISFNAVDLLDDMRHNRQFTSRTFDHARRALLGEITHRYIVHPSTHEPTVRALLSKEPNSIEQPVMKEEVVSKPYILAIGDIFTDAFIRISNEVGRVDEQSDGTKRFSIPWGSREPYEGVDIVKAVGPAPNAAVSGSRLGAHTGLMAFLGKDSTGDEAIEHLTKEAVDVSTMSVQDGLKSNYYYVLRMGAERTLLLHNEAYDYKWQQPEQTPDWIYLTELSPESWDLHQDLLKYLHENEHTKLAFQPGAFHFKWGVDKLAEFYKRTHLLVLNREEAMKITGLPYDSIRDLANALHELGPQKVVITDGPSGSYASYDFKLVTIPNYPDPAPPTDRTGAGDAFASTIVAALALGETMDTALTWAPINSASVVQKLGAQAGLLHREEVEKFLAEAPDWYKLTDFEG
jgi:sugar/nucleoside kinase (ribokinase family)